MIELIAHRGVWGKPEEKNTKEAFERAFELGFGVETDVRDYKGKLVISHDIPTSECMTFSSFLDLMPSQDVTPLLAINIKADGLPNKLALQLKGKNFFCFDMSVPDLFAYTSINLPCFVRYSEFEPLSSLLSFASGVWLDRFSDNYFNEEIVHYLLEKNMKVAMVSPELHGFEYNQYWRTLRKLIAEFPSYQSLISLCTDYPLQAKEFFADGTR